jgi:hypothetical protein
MPVRPLRQYTRTAITPVRQYGHYIHTPLCHYAITPVRQYASMAITPVRQYGHYAITPSHHYAITPVWPLRHYTSTAIAPFRQYVHYASTPVRPLRHSPHSLASVKDMYVEMDFPLNLYRHGCSNDCRGRANDCPGRWRRWNCLRHRLGGLWVLVVTVVCGVVRAGCVCVACPCCFVRGSRTKAHQKFGKPRNIGDRRKAGDETSQTITFN